MEGAEEISADGDVVTCGGRVDGDDRHDFHRTLSVIRCQFSISAFAGLPDN
jgi:hypothetical protein